MASESGPRRTSAVVLGLILALVGWRIAENGQRAVQQWDSISIYFALCGIVWIAAGACMVVGGIWTSFSHQRIPRVVASSAAVVAGAASVIGLLTSVIPCSGPS